MTKNEIKVLQYLYKYPDSNNHTDKILSRELNIERSILLQVANKLVLDNLIKDETVPNQKYFDETAWKITIEGVKKMKWIFFYKLLNTLKRTRKIWISLFAIIVTLCSVLPFFGIQNLQDLIQMLKGYPK